MSRDPAADFPDDPNEERRGSDPGIAYDRAVEEGEIDEEAPEEPPGPDVGDAFRAGT